MLLDLSPVGVAPQCVRRRVEPSRVCPGGVRARYPIERVGWIWPVSRARSDVRVARFRLSFRSDGRPLRFQFSADQFAYLYLDGHEISRGPDSGPPWFYGFSELELSIAAGEHRLEAAVWCFGDEAPGCRMSVGPGFALAGLEWAQGVVCTGKGAWEAAQVAGFSAERELAQAEVLESGKNGRVDAVAYFSKPPSWGEPVVVEAALGETILGSRYSQRILEPSNQKEMPMRRTGRGRIAAFCEGGLGRAAVPKTALEPAAVAKAAGVLEGRGELLVPPNTRVAIVWDAQDYLTGFPELVVSGGLGARITQIWGESFYDSEDFRAKIKGDRNRIEGKFLPEGFGDEFLPDGGEGRVLRTYWWRCGRYCVVEIATGAQPLRLHRISLLESGHEFDWAGHFQCDQDAKVQPLLGICRRTLEVGTWDTYVDSPYYEQLMYIGDTRLEMLVTYACSRNDEVIERALELLDASRQVWEGVAASRFPSRGRQLIPSFCLLWIQIVLDYGMWRGKPALVRGLLPGCRVTVDRFLERQNSEGLLEGVHGWPYVDWVAGWPRGIPPEGVGGVCALHNLIWLLALEACVQLEAAFGEPELASLQRRRAQRVRSAIRARFWNAERGLLADDRAHASFSQHAQILGILADVLTPEEGLRALSTAENASDCKVPSYVFRFYQFEAMRKLGLAGEILQKLSLWSDMLAKGAVTVWEQLEPTRSDCHAWSAHPLFHVRASVAGIRPGSAGFSTVRIQPQPGALDRISAAVPHASGLIAVDLNRVGEGWEGSIQLPAGLNGSLGFLGQEIPLAGGTQTLRLRPKKVGAG